MSLGAHGALLWQRQSFTGLSAAAARQNEHTMILSADHVRSVFAPLESGDANAFFPQVADDVSWAAAGTHPLAGEYYSKADFRAGTFAQLDRVLREGVLLRATHLIGARRAAGRGRPLPLHGSQEAALSPPISPSWLRRLAGTPTASPEWRASRCLG